MDYEFSRIESQITSDGHKWYRISDVVTFLDGVTMMYVGISTPSHALLVMPDKDEVPQLFIREPELHDFLEIHDEELADRFFQWSCGIVARSILTKGYFIDESKFNENELARLKEMLDENPNR